MNPAVKSKIALGLMDYISRGNHPLRPPQVQVLRDIVAHLESGHDYGYVKRPTGTGKTVNYVAEVAATGMPTLILTTRTNLIDQIKETFLDKNLYGFAPEDIGTYHWQLRSESERARAKKAPVLITTYNSYANLFRSHEITAKDRPLVILDEVHHARGDVIRPLVQALFDDAYVQGWTATDTFVTGQNIGHYLFNGKRPIHVTTIPRAISNGEIAPYKNIIVETHLGSNVKATGLDDLGDYNWRQLAKIIKETGRDEGAIRLFMEFHDPETGLALRDMKSIWYCAGIDHAETVTDKLADILGENYAVAVSSHTPKRDLREILSMHKNGEIPALISADLLVEGFDSPGTQLAMMLRPTKSPIVAEQTGGRILRIDPNNPGKIGYIVTFIDKGAYDVVPFGLVAGNMIYIPSRKSYFYHVNPGNNPVAKKPNYYDYPDVSVDVSTSVIALEDFMCRRSERLGVDMNELKQRQIIDAYETYSGNANEAAGHLPYDPSTIAKYWKAIGLKPRGREARVEKRQREIIAAYETYNGNASEAARHLPYDYKTIEKHWKAAGLNLRGIEARVERYRKEIIAAYETYNGNASEAERHLPYDRNTIAKHWRDAGLTKKPTQKPSLREFEERFKLIDYSVDEHAADPYGVKLKVVLNGVQVDVHGEAKHPTDIARRETLEAVLDSVLQTPDGAGLLPFITKLARNQIPRGATGVINGSYEDDNVCISVSTRYVAGL